MSKELTLYSITSELKQIEIMLQESGGEITEDLEEALNYISDNLTTKTDNMVGFVRSQEDFVGLIDSRIDELKDLKTKTQKGLQKLNDYILGCMDNLGEVKIEGQFNSMSIRKPTQVVDIYDEDELPLEYLKKKVVETMTIDKVQIKKDIKSGKEIPGAKLVSGNRKVTFK